MTSSLIHSAAQSWLSACPTQACPCLSALAAHHAVVGYQWQLYHISVLGVHLCATLCPRLLSEPGWEANLSESISFSGLINALIPPPGQLHGLLRWCEAGKSSGELEIVCFSWKSSSVKPHFKCELWFAQGWQKQAVREQTAYIDYLLSQTPARRGAWNSVVMIPKGNVKYCAPADTLLLLQHLLRCVSCRSFSMATPLPEGLLTWDAE